MLIILGNFQKKCLGNRTSQNDNNHSLNAITPKIKSEFTLMHQLTCLILFPGLTALLILAQKEKQTQGSQKKYLLNEGQTGKKEIIFCSPTQAL